MKKLPCSILIIDDDPHVILTSRLILKEHFEKIETLESPKTLESKLKQQEYDVILLDMNFKPGSTSGNEGIFWMNRIRQLAPHVQVVMQTAYGDIELAVKSMKEGAVDFLPKPWDKEKLIATVINAYQQSLARKENRELKSKQQALQNHFNKNESPFIASAASMQPVLQAIGQVAATDASVLILGENGTGKELVARAIHQQSDRAHESFITVDMGTITPSLFESEMFGHEKGAFTDAKESRIGKFELAHKGTIFLDEIGNLPPDLQVKLLSALQTRTVTKVGGNKIFQLDVRVICATNAPIYELVKVGSFRQDLFYRIKTVEIPLPPLRDRKEDIPSLFHLYFEMFKQRYHKNIEVGQSVIEQLAQYHWPGNIRELQHAVERAVILCREPELTLGDFQLVNENAHENSLQINPSLNLIDVEREVIRKAVQKHHNNLTKAAEELGIGRTTLYRKLEEHGLNTE
jgi:two-component system, NtrC family, response regulator HydG